jgi:hypothetical protein
MRRGMYRPASIISHAATACFSAPASDMRGLWCSLVSVLCDWLNFNFPALGCGHSGSISVSAHEMARGRSIRHKDHTFGHLAFDASEGRLTILGSDQDISTRLNPDRFHVRRMHRQRADNGLILGVIFTNVDLLPLPGRPTCVHDEALTFHSDVRAMT